MRERPAPAPNRRIRLKTVHEEPDLVVLDKPSGLTVHPGPGHGTDTLLNALIARYPELVGLGPKREFGLVHRLDLPTSGLLVVARTEGAYEGLVAAFSERRVEKEYVALVQGSPDPPSGEVASPVAEKAALTRYEVVARAGPVSQVVLRPTTGRTHQLRIHLASIGCPVLADDRYGEGRSDLTAQLYLPRLALHAQRLAFAHPCTAEPLAFEVAPPKAFRKAWRRAERLFGSG